MAEAQRKFIAGKEYTVMPLRARNGLKLFVKWGSMLGPSMAKMADPKLRKSDTTSDAFAGVLSELFTNLDSGPLDVALDELMATVYESDKPMSRERYDVEFAGNLAGLCEVVMFGLQAQFGDFYQAFAKMGATKEATKAPANTATSATNK